MLKEQAINCKGYLVWDYFRGEVICSSTGEIVDKIYEYRDLDSNKYSNEENTSSFKKSSSRKTLGDKDLLKKYKEDLALYNKALRFIRNKPWLTFDFEKLVTTRRFINTLYSKNTVKTLNNVSRMGLLTVLKKIISLIGEIEPSAICRTERTKLALAYIVFKSIMREEVDPKEVTSTFNISMTTYRRLEKIAKKILSKNNVAKIKAVIH